MIRKTESGYVEGSVKCWRCHKTSPWIPADRDLCTDEWWCSGCRTWYDRFSFIVTGSNPWMIRYYDENGDRKSRGVCAGPA